MTAYNYYKHYIFFIIQLPPVPIRLFIKNPFLHFGTLTIYLHLSFPVFDVYSSVFREQNWPDSFIENSHKFKIRYLSDQVIRS